MCDWIFGAPVALIAQAHIYVGDMSKKPLTAPACAFFFATVNLTLIPCSVRI